MFYHKWMDIVPCAHHLSILKVIVCIYKPQTPSPSHSLPPAKLSESGYKYFSYNLYLSSLKNESSGLKKSEGDTVHFNAILFYFTLSFFFFLSKAYGIWMCLGQGSNQSYSCWPTPQQLRIWATSVTYTTAHHNARSPTHWAKPGIEPTSSLILVGFISPSSF